MYDKKVEDVMSAPVFVISSNELLSRARNLMLKHRVSRLVVVEGEDPVGVITKTDISRAFLQPEPAWRRRPIDKMPVKHAMSKRLITVHPNSRLAEAADLMLENDISGLPVVENDGLLGVITMTDLVRHISTLNIDIEVSDVMEDFVPTVHRHHSMQHVVECMEENSTDRVVVLEDSGSPVGIITNSNVAMVELDVLLNKFEGGKEITTKMGAREGESRYRYVKNLPIVAEDIMTPTLIFTRADEQLNEAAASMIEHEIRGMPVVDDKGLVGLLTERNIITVLIKEG